MYWRFLRENLLCNVPKKHIHRHIFFGFKKTQTKWHLNALVNVLKILTWIYCVTKNTDTDTVYSTTCMYVHIYLLKTSLNTFWLNTLKYCFEYVKLYRTCYLKQKYWSHYWIRAGNKKEPQTKQKNRRKGLTAIWWNMYFGKKWLCYWVRATVKKNRRKG